MPLIRITDPADDRLLDYTGLTDLALRRRLETERGLYMAESTNVITRAIGAGHRPRSFLMAEKWLGTMAPVIARASGADDGGSRVPVFVAEEPVLEAITGFHLHRGALAAMHRPPLRAVEEVVAGARRVAIFDGMVDHTNLGAAFRSAAALGVDAVLMTPTSADPLYRRSVRVSMGTVFQVPWTRLESWPGAIEQAQNLGYTVAALALSDDSISLDEYVAEDHERSAFVFGPEGHGLSPRVLQMADRVVRIPMAAGVDSLNVAASAAVVFYATR
ncbi:RNA methyltransferase [Georgenia phoenicis]|uniref:TrmH family RNA methyltransferase n=1 Tax=unclassified Georgenia TaxID=2626815 RepID=UPI0039AF9CF1